MTFAWWLYCTRKGANPWSLQEELSAFYEDQESSKDSGEDPDRAAAKGIEHIRTLEARESEIRLQMADQIQLTRRSKDGKLAMHALAALAQSSGHDFGNGRNTVQSLELLSALLEDLGVLSRALGRSVQEPAKWEYDGSGSKNWPAFLQLEHLFRRKIERFHLPHLAVLHTIGLGLDWRKDELVSCRLEEASRKQLAARMRTRTKGTSASSVDVAPTDACQPAPPLRRRMNV